MADNNISQINKYTIPLTYFQDNEGYFTDEGDEKDDQLYLTSLTNNLLNDHSRQAAATPDDKGYVTDEEDGEDNQRYLTTLTSDLPHHYNHPFTHTQNIIFLTPFQDQKHPPILENPPASLNPRILALLQKQQKTEEESFLSSVFSYIKNLFCEAPSEDSDILTPCEALDAIKSHSINKKEMIQILDFLADKAASRDSFFRLFYGREGRMQDFCATLIKDLTDTDALLCLRKHLYPFANPAPAENSTNRDLFVTTLIKEIDERINKNLEKYSKDTIEEISHIEESTKSVQTYKKALAYLKSTKAEMPNAAQRCTDETREKESIALLKEAEHTIYKNLSLHVKDNFLLALRRASSPEEIKETYTQMMSYLNTLRSEMLPTSRPLTPKQIEEKSTDFLLKTLVNICIENDFKYQEVLEREVLDRPEFLIFIKYADKQKEIVQKQKNHLNEWEIQQQIDDWDHHHGDRHPWRRSRLNSEFSERMQEDFAWYPHVLQQKAVLEFMSNDMGNLRREDIKKLLPWLTLSWLHADLGV